MKNDFEYLPKWLQRLVAGVLLIALFLIGFYFWNFHGNLSPKQDTWGQFGDYVGGILNPLFSITALFALLHTVVLQTKELKKSTEQLEKSATALDQQKSLLEKQTFENTFFQLLTQFNGVVRDMHTSDTIYRDQKYETVIYSNRECISKLSSFLHTGMRHVSLGNYVDELSGIDSEYSNFYSYHGQQLGHYFRILYNLIKFIDQSTLNQKDKSFYTNLVRAQLSKYELVLIFYNCISRYGRDRFLPLVTKYNLLKHLEDDALSDPSHREVFNKISRPNHAE